MDDIVVVSDGFGADKAAREIGMNDTSRIDRLADLWNGPGAAFLRPCREIGNQAKEFVSGTDYPFEASAL